MDTKNIEHDAKAVTGILLDRLEKEGIEILLNAEIDQFLTANEVTTSLKHEGKKHTVWCRICRSRQAVNLKVQLKRFNWSEENKIIHQ